MRRSDSQESQFRDQAAINNLYQTQKERPTSLNKGNPKSVSPSRLLSPVMKRQSTQPQPSHYSPPAYGSKRLPPVFSFSAKQNHRHERKFRLQESPSSRNSSPKAGSPSILERRAGMNTLKIQTSPTNLSMTQTNKKSKLLQLSPLPRHEQSGTVHPPAFVGMKFNTYQEEQMNCSQEISSQCRLYNQDQPGISPTSIVDDSNQS